jgi:hypothetical protein
MKMVICDDEPKDTEKLLGYATNYQADITIDKLI